jgi:nicotinamide riboside transporter PnuC
VARLKTLKARLRQFIDRFRLIGQIDAVRKTTEKILLIIALDLAIVFVFLSLAINTIRNALVYQLITHPVMMGNDTWFAQEEHALAIQFHIEAAALAAALALTTYLITRATISND